MKKIDELRPGMEFSTAELSGSSKDKNNGPTLGTGASSFQSQTQSSKAQDKTNEDGDFKPESKVFGAQEFKPNMATGLDPLMQAGFEVKDDTSAKWRELDAQDELGGDSTLDLLDETTYNEAREEVVAKTGLGWLFWLLLGVVLIGGLEAWLFVSALWQSTPILGLVAVALSTVIIVWLIGVMWRDLRAVMFFKRTDANRLEYQRIVASGTGAQALKMVASMAKVSGVYGSSDWERFRTKVQDHYDALSVFKLYERMILRAQDEAARRIIVRTAADTAVVVALSPLAWFDMLAALFRTVRMVRRISEVYGMRLGFAGRIRLYRRVLKNLIFIGASELLTDAAADWLGAGVAGKLSAQLGQGMAAAIYSCRLGYLTVKELRPLELDREVLSLAILRRDVLANNSFRRLWLNSVKKGR